MTLRPTSEAAMCAEIVRLKAIKNELREYIRCHKKSKLWDRHKSVLVTEVKQLKDAEDECKDRLVDMMFRRRIIEAKEK